MFVLLFAYAVKLQVDAVLSRSLCGLAKLDVFSKTDSVRGGKDSVEAKLLCVFNCLEIVRRQSWLAAREQNDYLSSWFERDSAIKNRFRVFECRFVNVTNLIRIHEAGVAHHVAAVR